MCRRHDWIACIAMGLLVGPVQAQDDQQEREASEQAEPRQLPDLTLPFPVEIIEEPAQQEAREDRETQRDQREIEDLAAQQGMDTATRRMAETADFQASLAVWQTIAVVIGTIVLIATLFLTRRATRAAVKAANAATESAKYERTGNRPFLHPINYFLKIEEGRDGGVAISFCADVENIGGGPAFFDRFAAGHFTRGAGNVDGFDVFQLDEKTIEWRCFIRADARREWIIGLEGRLPFFVSYIPTDEWKEISDGWKELLIVGYFSYLDSYGVRWRSGFGFDCRHQMDERENLAQLSESAFWFDEEVPAKGKV